MIGNSVTERSEVTIGDGWGRYMAIHSVHAFSPTDPQMSNGGGDVQLITTLG